MLRVVVAACSLCLILAPAIARADVPKSSSLKKTELNQAALDKLLGADATVSESTLNELFSAAK